MSFMVRTQTLDAVREHGVRITSISGNVTVPAAQLGAIIDTDHLDAVKDENKFEADVIVMACKAWQIEQCLKMCRPWCGAKTLVLPLQNGVEGFDKIKSIVHSWGVGRALAGCYLPLKHRDPLPISSILMSFTFYFVDFRLSLSLSLCSCFFPFGVMAVTHSNK